MRFWTFLDYLTEARTNPLSDWYGTLEPEVQAAFNVLVDFLEITENWDHQKPKKRKYKMLTEKHIGLCELKFKVGSRKFRPFGIRHGEIREFVFLGGCEKKGFFGTTDPPNAFDNGVILKKAYDVGKGTTREHT